MSRGKAGIYAEGTRDLLRTLSQIGDEISNDAREASSDLATDFLAQVQRSASSDLEEAAAGPLRVYRDRVPKVGAPAGASTGVSGGASFGELFYGAEFGSADAHFPPITPEGRFFYPTLRASGPELASDWFEQIVDLMAGEWNDGARKAASR